MSWLGRSAHNLLGFKLDWPFKEMSRALQMVININWGVTIMDLMMNTTMAAKIIIFLVIVIIKVVVDLGSQLGLPNLSWGPSIGQKSGVRGGGSATATGTQWHPGGRLLLYTREGQPWLPLYQGVSEGVNRTCGRFSPGSTAGPCLHRRPPGQTHPRIHQKAGRGGNPPSSGHNN